MTQPERRLYRYKFGHVVLDEHGESLTVDGAWVSIQPHQRALLSAFLRRPGEPLSWQTLLDEAWDVTADVDIAAVRTAVFRLKKTLRTAGALIQRASQGSYRFTANVERQEVYRESITKLDLKADDPVPRRENFKLKRRLGGARAIETWLAEDERTSEFRVFKLTVEQNARRELQREYSLSKDAFRKLGERSDILRVAARDFSELPYFLELPYGGPDFSRWNQETSALKKMSVDARLRLFLKIADAVSALHAVPIVHCDLKPANILITEAGNEVSVRLIDFGSSLHLDAQRLAEVATEAVASPSVSPDDFRRGTLLYMAPERRAGAAGTVPSDIYALGMLLLQITCADLTLGLDSGWNRQISDRALRESILRATDHEPGERHPTVEALSLEVRRLKTRNDELTRQEQLEAELRRQRNVRPVLIGLIAALLAIVVVVTFSALREYRARVELAQQQKIQEAVNSFLIDDLIRAADPRVAGRRGVTVEDAAKAAATRVGSTLADDPKLRVRLRATLAEVFSTIGLPALSIEQARQAIQDDDGVSVLTKSNQIDLRLYLAHSLILTQQLDQAIIELKAIQDLLVASKLNGTEVEARLWTLQGMLAAATTKFKEALSHYEHAAQVLEANPNRTHKYDDVISLGLSDMYRLNRDFAASLNILEQLHGRQVAAFGSQDWRVCATEVQQALTLVPTERYDDADSLLTRAEICLREALGPTSRYTVAALRARGDLLMDTGRYQLAASTRLDVAQRLTPLSGESSDIVLSEKSKAVAAFRLAGEPARCISLATEMMPIAIKTYGSDTALPNELNYWIAGCRLDQHVTLGVKDLLSKINLAAVKEGEPGYPWEGRLAYEQGRLMMKEGNPAEGRARLMVAEKILGEWKPKDIPFVDRVSAALK